MVAAGRGPVDPSKGGYGNGILKFPLDLSKVEDYFIPANGVFLDNVSPLTAPTEHESCVETGSQSTSNAVHMLMHFLAD